MDVLVRVLNKFECFVRTNLKSSLPIVIHCVPGAGKSTIIRELLSLDTRFVAYTFGKPDPTSLSLRDILGPPIPASLPGRLLLIDEYTEGEITDLAPIAVFGDPLQTEGKFQILEAHYISHISHRFGSNTCDLLRTFNFTIRSDQEDSVTISGLYTTELGPVVIAVEDEVKDLLSAHGVNFLCLEQARGAEFDSVTFCTAENCIPSAKRAAFFVALTRHKKSLLILTPDATFAAS